MQKMFSMKLVFLSILTLSLLAVSKSSSLGHDDRNNDLLIKCLFEVLTKVVSEPDGSSLQSECKDVLQKQGSINHLLPKEGVMIPLEENEKRQEMESNARAQKIINALLKKNEEKHDDLNEERSQEEFPNYYKRHYIVTSKERREDPENERSQEEFPNYYKRHDILTSKERREDPDNERSQEEFPSYYKRHYTLTSKEKREDPEDERSQEEFPQKRYSSLSTKDKRENQDDERSQEEFPTYEHKRHVFKNGKEKRDNPDYDRSQEEFPSYVYKRYNDEDSGAEKQHWKPRNYRDKQYDDYTQTTSQEKKFEEEENEQYWNPLQQNHHRQHHKDNDVSSDEDMESEETALNENKQRYITEEEQKHHHIGTEERKQEKEAEVRYLTKKLNEHLLKDGEVNDKRNPWIYREYYHPAWYKKTADGDEVPIGPLQKLQELAKALRYKNRLSEKEMEEGKPYHNQRALSSEEIKELEKLTSVEQQA